MKKLCILLFVFSSLYSVSSFAQKVEEMKQETNTGAPPKPLDDEFYRMMNGEWSGTSDSNIGTAKEWQRCEWACDNQYVLIHYTNEMMKPNEEYVKKSAAAMGMSEADVEKMFMEMKYSAIGMMTMDAATGEYVGYWYDNFRGAYKGIGKIDGMKISMTWEGGGNSSVRTMELDRENTLIQTFNERDMAGSEIVGTSTMTRKKK